MWRKTTAFNKIAALDATKRYFCLQGSQGAGKTMSVLMQLICLAHDHQKQKIIIAAAQLTKMRLTVIADFVKVMKNGGLFNEKQWNKSERCYTFANGSQITFIGLDKEDIGKGLRCNVIYFNEANKIGFSTFRESASRANKVILDYNPNFRFWAHDEIITRDDCAFIKLTFEDNEMLGEAERAEILSYKEKGYNADGTIKSQYWANIWRVYGCGEVGVLVGTIFTNVTTGEFPNELPFLYGMDFGLQDPTTCVKVAVDEHRRKIYAKEILYSGNLSTRDIAEKIDKHAGDAQIIGDAAAAQTINDLRTIYGVNIKPCKKNKILDDIRKMQGYEIVCTCESVNLLSEFGRYVWLDGRNEIPSDKNNHAIDALRYAFVKLTNETLNDYEIL